MPDDPTKDQGDPAKEPETNADGGENLSKNDLVPSGRLREESDKRRNAETERDKLQKQIDDDKNAKLQEQGKHVEVIADLKVKNAELETKLNNAFIDFAIDKALQGVVNISDAEIRADHVDALSKHVDRNNLKVTDGKVETLRGEIVSQIDIMKQRSALKSLFGQPASDDNTPDPATDPDSTTAGKKPSNKVTTSLKGISSFDLSKMPREEFNKLAVSMGHKPIS